jgi:squalene synthase HpnC
MSSPLEATAITNLPKRAGQNIVLEDLKRFGPGVSFAPMSLLESQQYCKSLAKRHYENFSIASFLVPTALRQDLFTIYAYCRWSDDLADQLENASDSLRLLQWWRQELVQCFESHSSHPVFVALQHTIARHSLPREPFEHLLDAFVQDQTVNRYPSDSSLLEYCRGSANPVGRLLLCLAGTRTEESFSLSDSICSGLQIANFCQDMGSDAKRGRIYLPESRWQQHHLAEADILSGKASESMRAALRDWVASARNHLIAGLPLVTMTPLWLARDVQLFARGGLTILDNIEKSGFDVWSSPIEVSKLQKFALLARAIASPRKTT